MLSNVIVALALVGFAENDTQADKTEAAQEETLKVSPVEAMLVEYTNMERINRGLPPLEIDEELMKTSRKHALWMTNRRSMTHGRYPVAENIAAGQRNSWEAMRAWMNSSGHRANILNRSHRRMGASAYVTPSGTIYWCQQFLK